MQLLGAYPPLMSLLKQLEADLLILKPLQTDRLPQLPELW